MTSSFFPRSNSGHLDIGYRPHFILRWTRFRYDLNYMANCEQDPLHRLQSISSMNQCCPRIEAGTCTKAIIFCQILANFGIYRSHCLVYINQNCSTLPTFSTKSIGFSAIYSINKNFIASSMATTRLHIWHFGEWRAGAEATQSSWYCLLKTSIFAGISELQYANMNHQ